MESSVVSFRKFCNGSSDQVDKLWIEHHLKIMVNEGMLSSMVSGPATTQELRIDFFTFKKWAERNLNVHHLLNTFELVPSPVKERKTIIDILQSYERKNGDTMYAISYRWWDMWKQYTSQHSSTKEQNKYVEQLSQNLIENEEAPEFIRNFLMAYYEEQK